jgi:Uma2 family endonuclease
MMAPLPNIEHQDFVGGFYDILRDVVSRDQGAVLPGTNVSDRERGWEHNYRCPDVVVYLADNKAKNCETHWCGGPDFAVEISSDDDRTRDKIPFYAKVGTRELLIVDRDPWQLELLRLSGKTLKSIGKSTVRSRRLLRSNVLPLTIRLVGGKNRPVVRVSHSTDGRSWDI